MSKRRISEMTKLMLEMNSTGVVDPGAAGILVDVLGNLEGGMGDFEFMGMKDGDMSFVINGEIHVVAKVIETSPIEDYNYDEEDEESPSSLGDVASVLDVESDNNEVKDLQRIGRVYIDKVKKKLGDAERSL